MTVALCWSAGCSGLSIGSFLNVVVYRTPRHLSVVRARLLLPLVQRRRSRPSTTCPCCRGSGSAAMPALRRTDLGQVPARRSWRRPAVFVGLAATIRPLWGVPGWWALAATLGVAALIEADGQVLPAGGRCSSDGRIGVAALQSERASPGMSAPSSQPAIGLWRWDPRRGRARRSPRLRDLTRTGDDRHCAPFGSLPRMARSSTAVDGIGL